MFCLLQFDNILQQITKYVTPQNYINYSLRNISKNLNKPHHGIKFHLVENTKNTAWCINGKMFTEYNVRCTRVQYDERWPTGGHSRGELFLVASHYVKRLFRYDIDIVRLWCPCALLNLIPRQLS